MPAPQLVHLGQLPCTPAVKSGMEDALILPQLRADSITHEVRRLEARGAVGTTGFEQHATLDAFAWTPGDDPDQSLRLYVQRPRDHAGPRMYWLDFRFIHGAWPYAYRFGIGGRCTTRYPDNKDELVMVGQLQTLASVEEDMTRRLGRAFEDAISSSAGANHLAERWLRGALRLAGSASIDGHSFRWTSLTTPTNRSLITTTTARYPTGERAHSLEWRVDFLWGPYVSGFWFGGAGDRPEKPWMRFRRWAHRLTGGRIS